MHRCQNKNNLLLVSSPHPPTAPVILLTHQSEYLIYMIKTVSWLCTTSGWSPNVLAWHTKPFMLCCLLLSTSNSADSHLDSACRTTSCCPNLLSPFLSLWVCVEAPSCSSLAHFRGTLLGKLRWVLPLCPHSAQCSFPLQLLHYHQVVESQYFPNLFFPKAQQETYNIRELWCPFCNKIII